MTATATKFSAEDVWHMIDQDWLSDEMKALICKAIARLPLDVQAFAVLSCTFIDFGGKEKASAWPASVFTHHDRRGRTMRNHWLIILSRDLVKNEDDAQYTIAHEISHARLAHRVIDSNFLREVEADELVESWGLVVPKDRLKVHAVCRRLVAMYSPNEDEKALQSRVAAAKKSKPRRPGGKPKSRAGRPKKAAKKKGAGK